MTVTVFIYLEFGAFLVCVLVSVSPINSVEAIYINHGNAEPRA